MKKLIKALTGAEAVANAMRQINPDVVAAFPITPQTPIMHAFSKYVADGDVDTEMILVESEHSAMSAVVGAGAAGVRTMTATSSNGLALMHEIVYIAASSRLPIVMPVVNRALSGPINIHCDHSDTMAERDSSWIQIYSENAQEAYENTLLALKLAENKDVLLPVMVCMDGFITSHSMERVELLEDGIIKKFIGTYKPKHSLLNTEKPFTFGPLDFFDYYMEHKMQQKIAMKNAKKVYLEVGKELSKITGKNYGYFEEYKLKDAEYVIVTMSSTAGTTKFVVDELRKKGEKVGLLKLKLFRPFPGKEIMKVLCKKKVVAVLDRSDSFGAEAPLFVGIKSAMYDCDVKLQSYVFGLGGRDINPEMIEEVFDDLEKNKFSEESVYLGVR